MIAIHRDSGDGLHLVGTIENEGTEHPTFAYDRSYLSSRNPTPLSFSLPLSADPYGEPSFRPYFEGLLPEGPALRSLALELGVREEDYLSLLSRCGLDCIGDVVIDLDAFTSVRAYRAIPFEKLATVAAAPGETANFQEASRLSLAGTQSKCGLYHDETKSLEEGWYRPEGGAPSNCIVKFASDDLPDLMLVEYLCLSCARACGLDVPSIALLDLRNPALCINRFDRVRSNDTISNLPAPKRLHQEDFSQAFGLLPGSKYAELEPSTAAAIAAFIRRYTAYPAHDIDALARLICFNYLIGNCDNHLKNLSILVPERGKRPVLAPTYDVVCTTLYERFRREMGMKLGTATMLDEVTAQDIVHTCKEMNISPRRMKQIAKELIERAPQALVANAAELEAQGFAAAPYVADDLQADLAPRRSVLEQLIDG